MIKIEITADDAGQARKLMLELLGGTAIATTLRGSTAEEASSTEAVGEPGKVTADPTKTTRSRTRKTEAAGTAETPASSETESPASASQEATEGNATGGVASETAATTAETTATTQTAASPSDTPAEPDWDNDVAPKVTGYVLKHGREFVSGVLEQFGVERASLLDKSRWVELMNALDDASAAIS